jgi:misacylated tRNA(Ala) deacylase
VSKSSTTEEICATDAYARSTDATVLETRPEGVVLDRSVFYARGGGQPGDTGWLHWDGGECRVTDTVRQGGVPIHAIEGDAPQPGKKVRAEIDWERRHRLMRTHTALHALSGIVWRHYGAKVTGGNMSGPGEARMDFELDSISAEFGAEIGRKVNDALVGARPVRVLFIPRSLALADPDLIRTRANLIPESVDPIRVIDIKGIDRQADGGTHVASTDEVGTVRVVRVENKGRDFRRIRIALDLS